jgi:hypothetical protein
MRHRTTENAPIGASLDKRARLRHCALSGQSVFRAEKEPPMDLLTFIVEMSKAWAWPVTIFLLGISAVAKFASPPRK